MAHSNAQASIQIKDLKQTIEKLQAEMSEMEGWIDIDFKYLHIYCAACDAPLRTFMKDITIVFLTNLCVRGVTLIVEVSMIVKKKKANAMKAKNVSRTNLDIVLIAVNVKLVLKY